MMDRVCGAALAAVCLLSLTAPAPAADFGLEPGAYGWYIRGDIGAAITDADNQPSSEAGLSLGAGLGYRLTDFLRVDVMYDGVLDVDFGDNFGDGVDAQTVLGNVYFDLPVSFAIRPYVGAGIGWGQVNGGVFDDEDGVALAASAGLTWELATKAAIDFGYKVRYIDINTGVSDYWLDHNFRIGFRLGF